MTTAFVKIHNFINSLKDDEVIRATKQDLSKSELDKEKNENFKNDNGATHLYVRSGFFSKLRQVLTSRTDGAIEKQKMAKDLIIDALNSLPKELKNDNSVKNAFENIKQTLTSNDVKDFTAKMIREDLTTIYNALTLINRTVEINSAATKNNASATPVVVSPTTVAVSPTVVAASPTVPDDVSPKRREESLKTITSDEVISNGGDEPLEFESYFSLFGVGSGDNSAKKIMPNSAKNEEGNATIESFDSKANKERIQESHSDLSIMQKLNVLPDPVSLSGLANMQNLNALPNLEIIISQEKNTDNDEIPDGDDALSEVESGSDSDDEDGAVSSSESEMPANETSSDPAVDGSPVEEPSSKLAESASTINTTPAPIGKAIKQGTDTAEAATESTPSHVTSTPTSTADTKTTAKANPYLESLNTKWSAAENGYFEVSKPFYITSEMPTSKILAQAYLLPEGKKLEFFGKKGEASKLNKDQVVHGEHELRDNLDLTNEKRGTRPYLKLEVKLETKFFQPSTKVAQNPAVARLAEEYKNTLIAIYKDSVEKISAEYKKTNPGQELDTLVITPITSTEGILLPVESTALVLAVKEIQLGNPGLKIAISADKETHSDDIRAAYAT